MPIHLHDNVEELFQVSEKEFIFIVRYALKYLKISCQYTINFDFECIEDYTGFSHNHECDDNEFIVVISPLLRWDTMVKTIFHELVHVKQHIRKERYGNVWKGVLYDPSIIPYEELPWEAEAFAMEELMYNDFVLKDVFY